MNDTYTLSLTKPQLTTLMEESYTFREYVADQLVKPPQLVPVSAFELQALESYVKNNFGVMSRIAAIKYVREWATLNNYGSLNNLSAAKTFVDKLIPYVAL